MKFWIWNFICFPTSLMCLRKPYISINTCTMLVFTTSCLTSASKASERSQTFHTISYRRKFIYFLYILVNEHMYICTLKAWNLLFVNEAFCHPACYPYVPKIFMLLCAVDDAVSSLVLVILVAASWLKWFLLGGSISAYEYVCSLA